MARVIALDGPSGAGKSTIARMLAGELGFRYLDTGALYRASALLLVEKGVREEDSDEAIGAALDGAVVRFREGKVFLGDRDVSGLIRTPEMGHYSSVFSARRPVREFLLEVQRAAAEEQDVVAEGRDMGTVVFPGATRKFFVDASTAERARRRYLQLLQSGMVVTEEEAERDVVERDRRDSGRDLAPLRRAADAVLIDTTGKEVGEVIAVILSHIGEQR